MFTSASDTSKSLFIPLLGDRVDSNVDNDGYYADLWISAIGNDCSTAKSFFLDRYDGIVIHDEVYRYIGKSILGVCY